MRYRPEPGDVVVLQEIWRGVIWSARPMTLVAEAGKYIALWMPRGTLWKTATDPPGAERLPTRAQRFSKRMRTLEWELGDFVWDLDTLWLASRARPHAVTFGWSSGSFLGWYVNLQEPVSGTGSLLRTMDLMIDLVIAPSGEWRWKDEDELAALVEDGVFDDPRLSRRAWKLRWRSPA